MSASSKSLHVDFQTKGVSHLKAQFKLKTPGDIATATLNLFYHQLLQYPGPLIINFQLRLVSNLINNSAEAPTI